MALLIKRLFDFGPMLFAVGFLTPLIAQIIERMDWTVPWGLSPYLFGFIVAGTLGVMGALGREVFYIRRAFVRRYQRSRRERRVAGGHDSRCGLPGARLLPNRFSQSGQRLSRSD